MKGKILAALLLLPTAWLGYQRVSAQLRQPEVILVLGGATEREQFAASFAQQHPELEVWVSSGSNPEYAEWLFQEAHIARDRLHLDYRAVDTVTNFTTLVEDLEAANVRNLYLVTSDYHMRRAAIIGQIVLGSRNIAFRPLAVPSSDPHPENWARGLRDGARAVLWVLTGNTGSEFGQTVGRLLPNPRE